MIPVTHQLKAAPKRVERALLKKEKVERIKSIYARGAETLPSEYVVVHQEADEATKAKIKAQVEERRTQKKARNLGLARNSEVSELLVCSGQHNLLRNHATRVQARKFLDLRTQSEASEDQEPATA